MLTVLNLTKLKKQPRFYTFGVPQNKTKSKKKDAKETVPNANYLWINMFATALMSVGGRLWSWQILRPMPATVKKQSAAN